MSDERKPQEIWGYSILLKNQGEWMCPPCERYRHLPQYEEMYEVAQDNLRMLRNTGEEVRLVALLTEPEDTKELWERNRIET